MPALYTLALRSIDLQLYTYTLTRHQYMYTIIMVPLFINRPIYTWIPVCLYRTNLFVEANSQGEDGVSDLISLVVLGRHLDYVPLPLFSCCPQASLEEWKKFSKKTVLRGHAKIIWYFYSHIDKKNVCKNMLSPVSIPASFPHQCHHQCHLYPTPTSSSLKRAQHLCNGNLQNYSNYLWF